MAGFEAWDRAIEINHFIVSAVADGFDGETVVSALWPAGRRGVESISDSSQSSDIRGTY
jgi:hypothetical protein